MELQIQELVDTIKRNGVEEEQRKAAEVLADAKAQAEQLVHEAKKEAARIVEQARKDASVTRHSGEAAVQQAARDVLLSLEAAIRSQFDRLMKKTVEETITGDMLVSLIVQIVKSNLASQQSSIELPKAEFAAVAEALKTKLATEMKAGLTITPVEDVTKGFRISERNGTSYYDFGSEELVALMKPFLNPVIQQLVSTSSGK